MRAVAERALAEAGLGEGAEDPTGQLRRAARGERQHRRRALLADVVVARELELEAREQPELWAACIAGAVPEPELPQLLGELGFDGATVQRRFDCFAGASAEGKVSRDLRVQAVNVFARKPRRKRTSHTIAHEAVRSERKVWHCMRGTERAVDCSVGADFRLHNPDPNTINGIFMHRWITRRIPSVRADKLHTGQSMKRP